MNLQNTCTGTGTVPVRYGTSIFNSFFWKKRKENLYFCLTFLLTGTDTIRTYRYTRMIPRCSLGITYVLYHILLANSILNYVCTQKCNRCSIVLSMDCFIGNFHLGICTILNYQETQVLRFETLKRQSCNKEIKIYQNGSSSVFQQSNPSKL